MPISVRSALVRLRDHHQYILPTLLAGAVIGALRALDLDNLVGTALSAVIFLAGTLFAHLVFLIDEQVADAARQRIPVGEEMNIPETVGSPLRRGYMLLLLPVLAVFMISSTRAALGLGFFWGLSSVYWWDIGQYFRGPRQQERVRETYFDQFPDQSPVIPGIVIAYLSYGVILTGVLLLVQGMP